MSGVFIGEGGAEDGGDSSDSGNVEYEHDARLPVRLELEVLACADRGSMLLFLQVLLRRKDFHINMVVVFSSSLFRRYSRIELESCCLFQRHQ